MYRTRISLVLLVLTAISSPLAQEPNPILRGPEFYANDPQGGVLCIWGLYSVAQIIGDRCFPDEKSELKDVLNESIEKMDEFIVKNAPVSREDLEKRKAAERDYIMNRPGLCDASNKDNVLMLYQSARDLGPAAIREQIAKLLAIPRKPTMNPCV